MNSIATSQQGSVFLPQRMQRLALIHPMPSKPPGQAASLTLFSSYSGYQQRFEKAKIRTEFYTKLSARYERFWNQINQGLDDQSISTELDILLELEAFVPAPDEEYNDGLRKRVYKILIESKDVIAVTHG